MIAHTGYRVRSAREFVDACGQQGVELDNGLTSSHYNASHRPVRELVMVAAMLLRDGDPGIPLADRTIDQPVFPADRASSIMQRIINTSIEPVATTAGFSFPRQSREIARTCRGVETDFARTLLSIQRGQLSTESSLVFGGEIFVNQDGKALILRKSEGYSSGLALVDSAIGGTFAPKGGLLYVETPEGKPRYNVLPDNTFRIRPMEDIVDIGLTRLTAFASPPEQREVHHLAECEAGVEAYKLLTTLGTDALQPLVQTVVDSLR